MTQDTGWKEGPFVRGALRFTAFLVCAAGLAFGIYLWCTDQGKNTNNAFYGFVCVIVFPLLYMIIIVYPLRNRRKKKLENTVKCWSRIVEHA